MSRHDGKRNQGQTFFFNFLGYCNSSDETPLLTSLKLFSHNAECSGYSENTSSVLILPYMLYMEGLINIFRLFFSLYTSDQENIPLYLHHSPCGSQPTRSYTRSPMDTLTLITVETQRTVTDPGYEFHTTITHYCHRAASYLCLFR